MTLTNQSRNLKLFLKRKIALSSNLKNIDINDVLSWTTDELEANIKILKKCRVLKNTYDKFINDGTIIINPIETEPVINTAQSEPIINESVNEPVEPVNEPVEPVEPPPKKKQKKKSKTPKKIINEPVINKLETIPPELKKINTKTKKIQFIKSKNDTIEKFIIEFKNEYKLNIDLTATNTKSFYDKIDTSEFKPNDKQLKIIKDAKQKLFILNEIEKENINSFEYETLDNLYYSKIDLLKVSHGKQKLIEIIKKDNKDISKKTIEFYIKYNISSDDEITEDQFNKLKPTRITKKNQKQIATTYQITEPKKINFTIDFNKCVKENNKIIKKIKQLKTTITPNNKELIKSEINKLKYNLIMNPIEDELTMLKFEKIYGKNLDQVKNDMIYQRILFVNPVKPLMF